jgi:hypothetical protein
VTARILIDLGGGAVEITVRSVGECTCAAPDDVHEAACGVLRPARVDLIVDDPGYLLRRNPWWRRPRSRRPR